MSEIVPLFGFHAVNALLMYSGRPVHQLWVLNSRHDQRMQALIALAEQRKIPMMKVSLQQMNQRFKHVAHQGVVAFAEGVVEYTESNYMALIEAVVDPLILILDEVSDPHNFGACLRTADAMGVTCVITPKDRSAPLNGTVSKVASGAMESMPIVRASNLARVLIQLKKAGIWIYGAAGDAPSSIETIRFKGPIAVVMGAEGQGLRRLTKEHCDGLFSIPMRGHVSSFNVSVATAIVLYEACRQRQISL